MPESPSRKEKTVTLVWAFALPALLACLAFAAAGIYPFGEKSMLIVDMYNEYIDYLAQMNETVRSSGSFLRSWNMGMGLNMLGLIAFYTASPFNLIILLLPLEFITEAVFAVTLLKLGLCGLLFAVFSANLFPEADRIFHVLFAVAYALCAYNIAYSSNIMWLDGSAFLPLTLLGVEKLLRGESRRLLFGSLVYVFFTSYYIGYMIGIFSFLYFTARYFSETSGVREYLRLLLRFAGNAALAAGCLAFLLLPAFLSLRNGQTEMWQISFEPRLRYPLAQISAKLLPGVYDSLTNAGLPNIYCTVLGVTLCFLYFCAKAVPLREKLIFGGLLGFLPLSFSCEFLDVAWHAFEYPTWFPARYSFVFSFLVLYLALRSVSLLERISRRAILAAACLPLLLFIEVAVNRFSFMRLKSVVAGILLVCAYGLALAAWPRGNRRTLSAALTVFVCMEAFGNAAFMALGMDDQFTYHNREEYRDFIQRYSGAAELAAAMDPGVYRTEILGQRSANGAMALGYNGISHYSSTTDQSLNAFLRGLGYNRGTVNELRFSANTPLTNGLLGIRHVLSAEPMGSAYRLLGSVDGVGVYENTMAWPMAFWAPESALDFEARNDNGPFELQNGLVKALTGVYPVFIPLSSVETRLGNAEKKTDGGGIEYVRQIRSKNATIGFTVENPGENEAYAFFPVYKGRFSGSEIFVGGEYAGWDLAYRSNTIIPLGNAKRSEVEIVPDGERLHVESEYFAALDLDAAQEAANKAAEHGFAFTVFRDTRVEGRITSPEDGVLATTFPYDKGWTATVDGRRAETARLAGVFLAIPLSKGEHIVSMRYSPPGFRAGVAVSFIIPAGMLFYSWHKRRTKVRLSPPSPGR